MATKKSNRGKQGIAPQPNPRVDLSIMERLAFDVTIDLDNGQPFQIIFNEQVRDTILDYVPLLCDARGIKTNPNANDSIIANIMTRNARRDGRRLPADRDAIQAVDSVRNLHSAAENNAVTGVILWACFDASGKLFAVNETPEGAAVEVLAPYEIEFPEHYFQPRNSGDALKSLLIKKGYSPPTPQRNRNHPLDIMVAYCEQLLEDNPNFTKIWTEEYFPNAFIGTQFGGAKLTAEESATFHKYLDDILYKPLPDSNQDEQRGNLGGGTQKVGANVGTPENTGVQNDPGTTAAKASG